MNTDVLELALIPEYDGLQNRTSSVGMIRPRPLFTGTVSDYSYLDYSLQKPFSTVEELAAYETRIYLNEYRDSATGEVTLDPVLFDAYTATDDVEVRYAFCPAWRVPRTTGSGKTPRALAWRYAVENLGVEARQYADDEEPVIYVNWTDADGGLFEHTRQGPAPPRRFPGPDLERRVRLFQTVSYR